MKKVEHLIKEVYPGSIAEELEIEPGDVLLSINDQSIEDDTSRILVGSSLLALFLLINTNFSLMCSS